MKSNTSGFSLVEMVVVCAIVALLVTLSFFGASFIRRWSVYTECVHLHAVCRYLQQRALSTHTTQKLVLNTHSNTYRYNNTEYALPPQVVFGVMHGIQGPPAQPTHTVTDAITFPSHTVTFYPNGVIQAGTLYMTDTHKSCCYALSNAVARIAHIRRYVWDSAWHLCTLKD